MLNNEESRSAKLPKLETSSPMVMMNHSIEIVDLEDDETFLTPLLQKGTSKANAISVDQYSEDKEFQLAIMASLLKPATTANRLQNNFIHLDDDYNDDFDDLHILNFEPQYTPRKRKKPFPSPSASEIGQSSNSRNSDSNPSESKSNPSFVCEICVEPRSANESFRIKGCSHAYCKHCVIMYVASKLQENITSIPCPVADCQGLLEPDYCRDLLPEQVFVRWGNALCEAAILGAQKFYCPYKDCSALLIDDGGVVINQSECPNCRRLFCAQCKVPWHAGMKCEEFQKLNKDESESEDIMLMKLAQKKKWKRCPHCKYYVEKQSGCMYMMCRCGHPFCYNCGATFNGISHTCSRCRY